MRWEVYFIVGLFLINFGIAVPELSFQNEDIQPGETVFGEVSVVGTFEKEISKSDISFFEGRKDVFFEYDLIFRNETYYFYFYAVNEGGYRMVVDNILYKDASGLGEASLEKEFNVSREVFLEEDLEGNETAVSKILSIRPGFVFSLEVPVLKLSNKGNTSFNVTYLEEELELSPLEVFDLEYEPETEFSFFEISAYRDFSVPVIYLKEDNTNVTIGPFRKGNLRPSPESFATNLIIDEEEKGYLELFNFGDENITGISFDSGLDFMEFSELGGILGKERVNLTLSFVAETEGHFESSFQIYYVQNGSSFNLTVPLDIYVFPEGTNETEMVILDLTCEEKNGTVCNSTSKCNGDTAFTKGGDYCCFGVCNFVKIDDPDSGKGNGTLIGILIFVVLGIVGFLIWKKSKKAIPKTSEEKLTEAGEDYSKRISGGLQRN